MHPVGHVLEHLVEVPTHPPVPRRHASASLAVLCPRRAGAACVERTYEGTRDRQACERSRATGTSLYTTGSSRRQGLRVVWSLGCREIGSQDATVAARQGRYKRYTSLCEMQIVFKSQTHISSSHHHSLPSSNTYTPFTCRDLAVHVIPLATLPGHRTQ